jgi:hypothetical protein
MRVVILTESTILGVEAWGVAGVAVVQATKSAGLEGSTGRCCYSIPVGTLVAVEKAGVCK